MDSGDASPGNSIETFRFEGIRATMNLVRSVPCSSSPTRLKMSVLLNYSRPIEPAPVPVEAETDDRTEVEQRTFSIYDAAGQYLFSTWNSSNDLFLIHRLICLIKISYLFRVKFVKILFREDFIVVQHLENIRANITRVSGGKTRTRRR